MNNFVTSVTSGLWDRDAVYDAVGRWLESDGRGFLKLPASQVANLTRVVWEIEEPEDLLPPEEGKRVRLASWLEEAAERGDERGPWRRKGEVMPLTLAIPRLFESVLEETLENQDLKENQKFYGIWRGKEPEEVIQERKMAVLREAMAALVKSYRSRRPEKGRHHGK